MLMAQQKLDSLWEESCHTTSLWSLPFGNASPCLYAPKYSIIPYLMFHSFFECIISSQKIITQAPQLLFRSASTQDQYQAPVVPLRHSQHRTGQSWGLRN